MQLQFDSLIDSLLNESHNCECGCDECGPGCPCDKNCECKHREEMKEAEEVTQPSTKVQLTLDLDSDCVKTVEDIANAHDEELGGEGRVTLKEILENEINNNPDVFAEMLGLGNE